MEVVVAYTDVRSGERHLVGIRESLNLKTVGEVREFISSDTEVRDMATNEKLSNIDYKEQIMVYKTEDDELIMPSDETLLDAIEDIDGIKLHVIKKRPSNYTAMVAFRGALEGILTIDCRFLLTAKIMGVKKTVGSWVGLHWEKVKLITLGKLLDDDAATLRDYSRGEETIIIHVDKKPDSDEEERVAEIRDFMNV